MNLPNKLTILRVVMIPFFVLFMVVPLTGEGDKWIALALFIVASLTDLLDGHIARKYNLITNFGKFMDPLADKLLVCSALICLVELGRIPSWMVIVIIAREFIISGFRLIASDNGVVIAASYWGKFKTTFQMVMICLMIANLGALHLVTEICYYISLTKGVGNMKKSLRTRFLELMNFIVDGITNILRWLHITKPLPEIDMPDEPVIKRDGQNIYVCDCPFKIMKETK